VSDTSCLTAQGTSSDARDVTFQAPSAMLDNDPEILVRVLAFLHASWHILAYMTYVNILSYYDNVY
jgi:hypothetical protein